MRGALAIIGAGRVGRALGRRLHELDWKIGAVITRSEASARRAVRFIGAGKARATLSREVLASRLILISTPDDAIVKIAEELARIGAEELRGKVVLHTSGALNSGALKAVRDCGACVASMHPLQSFSGVAIPPLEGKVFAIEGDPVAIRLARQIVRALGGQPVQIAGGSKVLYHAAAAFAALFATAALAQSYPDRPVHLLVPFPPGGGANFVARVLAQLLSVRLGQSVVVENRPGNNGNVAGELVARAAPDGYTILVNSTSYVVVASTYAKLPYDPYEDMVGIALLAHFPFVVATSRTYKNLADLVAAGRLQPSPLTSASLGIGSSGHLAIERLLHAAKFQATVVPFRGAPEAVAELAAGRLDMYVGVLPNVLELAKAGEINLVGVMSPKRSALIPDVPTTIEAGYPDSDYNFWMGSYLPAKTPRPIVERLNAEVAKALQDEGLKTKIRQLAGEVETMSVDQFNTFIVKERAINAEIVKLIGYQPR